MPCLDFISGADNVNCGSAAELDNNHTGSAVLWVYKDGVSGTNQMLFCKDSATHALYFGDFSGEFLWFAWGGNLEAIVYTSNLPNFGQNKWICIAATWDDGGGNSAQKLFCGDENNDLAEVSAANYVSQDDSAGAPSSNAANDLLIGGDGSAAAFDGKVGPVGIWDTVLSLTELQNQQKYGRPVEQQANCQGYWFLGRNGTGTQRDLSGNGNDGAVNGAALNTTLHPLLRYETITSVRNQHRHKPLLRM